MRKLAALALVAPLLAVAPLATPAVGPGLAPPAAAAGQVLAAAPSVA